LVSIFCLVQAIWFQFGRRHHCTLRSWHMFFLSAMASKQKHM
jgi:hypothetical protein